MVYRKRNSENKSAESIEERLQDHEERIRTVESERDHEGIDAFLSGKPSVGVYELYGEMISTEQPPVAGRKVGKPPSISSRDFAIRRDRMVYFFEGSWQELEPILASRFKTPAALKAALIAIFPGREGSEPLQRVLANVEQLWHHLQSQKTLIPRNLAYAMAGAPELTLRSSLDRCEPSKEPCELPIHFYAMGDHIRRRHPRWFACLVAESSTEIMPTLKALKMLPARCPECKRFRSRPERIFPAICAMCVPAQYPKESESR